MRHAAEPPRRSYRRWPSRRVMVEPTGELDPAFEEFVYGGRPRSAVVDMVAAATASVGELVPQAENWWPLSPVAAEPTDALDALEVALAHAQSALEQQTTEIAMIGREREQERLHTRDHMQRAAQEVQQAQRALAERDDELASAKQQIVEMTSLLQEAADTVLAAERDLRNAEHQAHLQRVKSAAAVADLMQEAERLTAENLAMEQAVTATQQALETAEAQHAGGRILSTADLDRINRATRAAHALADQLEVQITGGRAATQ